VTLSSKERAELRAQAHHLQVMVHVGHQGATESLKQALDEAFTTRELVKVQFSKNADVKAKDAANELAASVDAEVVQTIGRTATLYRYNPDLKKPKP
jgi:RNA-binding protein